MVRRLGADADVRADGGAAHGGVRWVDSQARAAGAPGLAGPNIGQPCWGATMHGMPATSAAQNFSGGGAWTAKRVCWGASRAGESPAVSNWRGIIVTPRLHSNCRELSDEQTCTDEGSTALLSTPRGM